MSSTPVSDPVAVPTITETQEALARISPHRDPKAAAALQALAEELVKVVSSLDRSMRVSDYLTSIVLTCEAPDIFKLEIQDRNAGVNLELLNQAIANDVLENHHAYGKALRPISLTQEPSPDDGPH